MTESSTSDKTKSTPTTTRSKASSTEAEAAPAAPDAEASSTEAGVGAFLPGFIRNLRGFGAALEAIEAARKKANLPNLTPTDYRFILKRPGGIPFSFPVQVIYKPESPAEKDLGTFRIGR